MKKTLFIFLFAFVANAAMAQTSGTCGTNLTWAFQDSVLTISGSGGMQDYVNTSNVPWSGLRSEISSIIIGNRVTSIGKNTFCNCTNLTSITIPNRVTSIGEYAFYGCTSLTSITIPNSVTDIGRSAFKKCGLDSVTIPNSVTEINHHLFEDCENLVFVNLPNSVVVIGESAFAHCSNLNSITIPNSVTGIWEYAFSGSSLDTIVIPNRIKAIRVGTFVCGSNVIMLGDSVMRIEKGAFGGHRAESITIPKNVSSISSGAFYSGHKTLKTVIFESVIPPYYDYIYNYISKSPEIFYDKIPQDFKIYVPCGSLDAYKNAEGWSFYAECFQYEPSVVKGVPLVQGTGMVSVPEDKCGNTIEAIPAIGYQFVKWTDGNTDNPRSIDPDIEVTYTAVFDQVSGIEDISNENHIKVKKVVENSNLNLLLPDGTRYDATGKKVQ